MKRIMMLVLSLATISGVHAATTAPATGTTAPATEKGYMGRAWDGTKGFFKEHVQDYHMATDIDEKDNARRNARIRRGVGSALGAGGLGLAAAEIAMNRNFFLEFLSKYIKNEGAQNIMNKRTTKLLASLLQAVALDELGGLVNGQGGRRGLVSGGIRDGYAWGKKKWGKKSSESTEPVKS